MLSVNMHIINWKTVTNKPLKYNANKSKNQYYNLFNTTQISIINRRYYSRKNPINDKIITPTTPNAKAAQINLVTLSTATCLGVISSSEMTFKGKFHSS